MGHAMTTVTDTDFEQEVSIVVDGGTCDVGIESTIVDFTQERPRILRPGSVTQEQLEETLGQHVEAQTMTMQGALYAKERRRSTYR